MTKPAQVVLQSPLSDPTLLAPFVEGCLRDGVQLIAVVGEGCDDVEEEIDWIVVGDGTDDTRFFVTSSHPDETLEEVIAFASGWDSGQGGPARVVAF